MIELHSKSFVSNFWGHFRLSGTAFLLGLKIKARKCRHGISSPR